MPAMERFANSCSTDLKQALNFYAEEHPPYREQYLHFCIKMNPEHLNVPIISGLFKMLKRW